MGKRFPILYSIILPILKKYFFKEKKMSINEGKTISEALFQDRHLFLHGDINGRYGKRYNCRIIGTIKR